MELVRAPSGGRGILLQLVPPRSSYPTGGAVLVWLQFGAITHFGSGQAAVYYGSGELFPPPLLCDYVTMF